MNTPNTNLSNQQEQDALLNAISETNTTPPNTLGQQLGKGIRQSTLALGLALSSMLGTQSCEMLGIGPKDKTEVKKLSDEQQKIVDLLKPNPDGTPKSFVVSAIGDNPRYSMPNVIKFQVELVDPKNPTQLKVTPIISKAPIETSLRNAYEDDQASEIGANLALGVEESTGPRTLTSTFGILLKDDNNPMTSSPAIDQLPDQFTIDYMLKFAPLNFEYMKKSYYIGVKDKMSLYLQTLKLGKKFMDVKIDLDPLALIQQANKTGN